MEPFTIAVVCFWTCAVLVVYAYLGYPVLIWVLARVFGQMPAPPHKDEFEWPSVSLLIPAYNEERVIEERIRNALAMDYPADRLQIVVGSDGSTDATNAIARSYAGQGVELLDYEVRRGKASILNQTIPGLRGELVLMSDANTMIDFDALRRLAQWFHDPSIGAVCGRLVLIDPANGRNVDGLYWTYETFIKKCENQLGALLGANGGLYLVRRALYAPIPATTTVDDLVIPLRAKLATGCRIVYEASAVAREETAPDIEGEFRRRARNGTGDFRSMEILWPLLNPVWGWTAFAFFSHKFLRLLCPFLLILLLASSVILSDRPIYRAALLGQLGFYLIAVAAGYTPLHPKVFRFLRLTTMFSGMNLALLLGFWRWIWGTQKGIWNPTGRQGQRA
ncbi:glycosyltransferase family 2 protein (plasmid) [Isosphaeraceae bacterium EP7]